MITNSRIAYGDQSRAQMTSLTNLIYLSTINSQVIIFWDELRNFRRGYQVLDAFECDCIRLLQSNNSLIRWMSRKISRIDTTD